MRPRRAEDRVTKRFAIRFHVGDNTFEATTSNLSPHGIFIRTPHCFKAGARIRLELEISDEEILLLEGFVRRAIKTRLGVVKNGMGVELDTPDPRYLNLVRTLED